MSETLPLLAHGDDVLPQDDVTLVDLLDRLLAGGVVITGDITLALADIDLVHLSLRLVVSSTPTLQPGGPAEGPAP
jgi:Gas vesicle protein